jgi:hypothetical protein
MSNGDYYGGPDPRSPEAREADERTKELLRRAGRGIWGFLTGPRGEGMVPYLPSRDTTQDLATGGVTEKDVAAAKAKAAAVAAAEQDKAGKDPRGQGASSREDPGSADEPLPKAGGGPGAELDRPEASRDKERAAGSARGRARAVKLPDGSIVMTNAPEVEGIDPEAPLYTQGIGQEVPSDTGVVSGAGGTMFLGGDAGDVDFGEGGGLPQDRSPGWATRAAYNELYRKGELSMDPIDIADRQRWEEHQTAKETEKALVLSQAEQAIARAKIDPLEAARIEAEGRFGGQIIKEEALVARIRAAVSAYKEITEEMNRILAEMPDSPERKRHLDRLERERREYANLVLGAELRDPRLDPMAAMLAAVTGQPSPPTTPEK